MRVCVCGGRNFGRVPRNLYWADVHDQIARASRDVDLLVSTLDEYQRKHHIDLVICGEHGKAEREALTWAATNGVETLVVPIPDQGPAQDTLGRLRNRALIDQGKPDLILAFSGGETTADLIGLAREAGIEVKEL